MKVIKMLSYIFCVKIVRISDPDVGIGISVDQAWGFLPEVFYPDSKIPGFYFGILRSSKQMKEKISIQAE